MTKPFRSTDHRSYRCLTCGGMVKAPRKRTIEEVRATHDLVCAGRGRGPGR